MGRTDSSVLLFAYGTLRPASDSFSELLLPPVQHVTTGTIVGRIVNYHDKFPVLLQSDDARALVQGDVLQVATSALRFFDNYEGHPHLYARHLVTVTTPDGPLQAWAYFGNEILRNLLSSPQDVRLIMNGDWLNPTY